MNSGLERVGVSVAFLGVFILSFDTLVLRIIDHDPLTMAFWRGVLMFTAVLPVSLAFSRLGFDSPKLLNGRKGLAVALFYGAASVFFTTSAMLTTIANMLVIVATAPLWAAIGSAIFIKEPISRLTWLTCIAGFIGIGFVAWPSFRVGIQIGDVLALGASLSMAGAFVMSRTTQQNLVFAPAIGGLISAVVIAPFITSFTFDSSRQFTFMLFEGAILVPVALGLIAIAPRYIPAPQVGLFLLLETILGPTWVWAVLGESPSSLTLAGGIIVISALLVSSSFTLIKTRSLQRSN